MDIIDIKRYRKGKDITNRLHVLTNKEPRPLAGRDLRVHLIDNRCHAIDMPFTVTDVNTLEFMFWGIDQKVLGIYKITVWENFGKHGQTVVDVKDAFRLVPDTSMEGGQDPEGLDTEVNDITINLSTGVRGEDGVGIENIVYNPDYTMTITLTDGTTYTSPVLRGEKGETGETGPQGPQGPAGEGGAFIYTIDASGVDQTGTKTIQGSAAYDAILAAYNAGKSVFVKWDDGRGSPYILSPAILEEYQNEVLFFDFTLSVSAPSGLTIFCDAVISSNGCNLTYNISYNVKGDNSIQKVVSISESAYNALATKDSSTLYVITEQ